MSSVTNFFKKSAAALVTTTMLTACSKTTTNNYEAEINIPQAPMPTDTTPDEPVSTPAFASSCPPLSRFSELGGSAGTSFLSFEDTGVDISLLDNAEIVGDLFECNRVTYRKDNALLAITGDFGIETDMGVANDDISGRLLVLDEGGSDSNIILENLGHLDEITDAYVSPEDESIITIRFIREASDNSPHGNYEARKIFANLVGSNNNIKAVDADLGEVDNNVNIDVVSLKLSEFINASSVRAIGDVDACNAWAQPGARVISDTGAVCFERVFDGAAIEGFTAIVETVDAGATVVGAERVDILGPDYSCDADIRGGYNGDNVYFQGNKLERDTNGNFEGCSFDSRSIPLNQEFKATEQTSMETKAKPAANDATPVTRGVLALTAS